MRITTLPLSDDALLERARDKDQQAFRLLVKRHEQQVRATVTGMLGDATVADDVAQEVFIRLYRSLGDFRGEARLSTYLSRIAINLSINELKRRQKRQRRFVRWSSGAGTFPEDRADLRADPERHDNRQWVWQALQELSNDHRAVVVLRMIDGYSVQETAEILKVPSGTVASRLSRAIDQLKPILRRLSSPDPSST